MSSESITPLLGGLAGGLLAMAFCRALSRWVPRVCNGKNAEALLSEYRTPIFLANAFFLGGLLVGIGLYQLDIFIRDDWRGIALGAGGGSACALAALGPGSAARGNGFKEGYVAFAVSQMAPIALVYGVLFLCTASFFVALATLG